CLMGPVKAALESVVRYMAAELAPKGIRVHALSPGPVKTRAASGIDCFDEILEQSAARAPIHRLVGLEDVGAVAAFLVGDWAKSLTGSTTYVDAGYHIMGQPGLSGDLRLRGDLGPSAREESPMDYIENRTFDEIKVGDSARLVRTLTKDDINIFAAMSGDVNPAHMDEEYARSDPFHKIIAHGMWSGSLISTLLGTKLPGPGAIYLGQTLTFWRP